MDTIPAFYPVGEAAGGSLEILGNSILEEVDTAQTEENERREATEGLNFL